jgi:2-polyprenyl-6-hydroxyphenyl methylase/3-demethylubiquinone-9 3-methyltransferase
MSASINNQVYEDLGERWYTDDTHPIALLKRESEAKAKYVTQQIGRASRCEVLDIGCGAGFVSSLLANGGMQVTGVDLSPSSIAVAQRFSAPAVKYQVADATELPFKNESFDACLLLDCLEHIQDYPRAIAEAARVTRPGGRVFFHTFNRTWLSYLLAVKALDWLGNDKHIHVYPMLIKPDELNQHCEKSGLKVVHTTGIMPDMTSKAFWWSLAHRQVAKSFHFKFTKSTAVGYIGYALKSNRGDGVAQDSTNMATLPH